jgi:molecular chaperone GrpE
MTDERDKGKKGTPPRPSAKDDEITIEFVDHDEGPLTVSPEDGSLEELLKGGQGKAEVETDPVEILDESPELPRDSEQPDKTAELEDRLLRSRADFENFRRRVARDREEYRRQATAEAVGLFLPILDDLERAVKAIEPGVTEHYVQGLTLVQQQFREALRKMGVSEIEAEGEPFDPALHEAVNVVVREDLPPMTVTAVFGKGYELGGKVLRPARVEVSGRPDEPAEGEDA